MLKNNINMDTAQTREAFVHHMSAVRISPLSSMGAVQGTRDCADDVATGPSPVCV